MAQPLALWVDLFVDIFTFAVGMVFLVFLLWLWRTLKQDRMEP